MLPNRKSISFPGNLTDKALQIPQITTRNNVQDTDRNAESDHKQIQTVESYNMHSMHTPQSEKAKNRQTPLNQRSQSSKNL